MKISGSYVETIAIKLLKAALFQSDWVSDITDGIMKSNVMESR